VAACQGLRGTCRSRSWERNIRCPPGIAQKGRVPSHGVGPM